MEQKDPLEILIAPDSFKHSLPAKEVCNYLSKGLIHSRLRCRVQRFPMADGGEGTMEALVAATDGTWIEVQTYDPLMRPLKTHYGITGDGVTAIIEMAAASGIERLLDDELDPMGTTTYGTGQLVKHAVEQGCTEVIIGLGGSATIDGGVGFCQGLGGVFYDMNGTRLLPGDPIYRIYEFDLTKPNQLLNGIDVLAACDVANPLLGSEGAARTFGPQKGADHEQVQALETALKKLYSKIEKQQGKSIAAQKGAGAAGGLGAGIVAFANGTLTPGFELIADRANLELAIEAADVVITGEGKLDAQTAFGKTPYGVARLAKKYNKPVVAIAGTLAQGHQELYDEGFDILLSLAEGPATLKELIENAPGLLINTGERIGQLLKMMQQWQF
ncbi:MAG: glycerate kinase [Bacteroidales bacterium]